MNIWIGLSEWHAKDIAQIKAFSPNIKGIIIGDPFCQRRMFTNGQFDLPSFAIQAKWNQLSVALQTPVYMTSRVFDEILQLVNYLHSHEALDLLMVQDIGLLKTIKNQYPDIAICWSLWGDSRSHIITSEFLDFIIPLGVKYIETDRASRIEFIRNQGLGIGYCVNSPKVATFGRVCYTEHLLEQDCHNKALCRQQPLELFSELNNISYKVSGHYLESPTRARKPFVENVDFLTWYAENLKDLSSEMESMFISAVDLEEYRILMPLLSDEDDLAIIHLALQASRRLEVPLISPEVSYFLYNLVKQNAPRKIVEIGSAVGFSTFLMALACPETKITAIDINPTCLEELINVAERFNLASRISIVCKDACTALNELDGGFDFVFIDADKEQYCDYIDLIKSRLAPAAIVIADDVLLQPGDLPMFPGAGAAMERFRAKLIEDQSLATSILPLGPGVSLSILKPGCGNA